MTIRVALVQEGLQDGDLGRYLIPADDGGHGPLAALGGPVEIFQILGQEESRHGRLKESGDALRGGVGPMGRPEGVVDVQIERGGKPLHEGLLVLRLNLVEAGVLEQEDVSLPGGADHGLDLGAAAVRRKLHLLLSSSPIRRAQGWRERFCPPAHPCSGPRWEHTATMAPLETRYSIIGIEQWMRVSSVMILPCSAREQEMQGEDKAIMSMRW